MDLTLLARLLRVERAADATRLRERRVGDGSEEAMRLAFSAQDALDYLGRKIDADRGGE